MIGNCPKCAEPISRLIASSIRLEETHGALEGIAYLCPNCSSVVGISVDPRLFGKGFARTNTGKRAVREQ
jgi:hypothetical protein